MQSQMFVCYNYIYTAAAYTHNFTYNLFEVQMPCNLNALHGTDIAIGTYEQPAAAQTRDARA